jgi:hypothetical protein
VASTKKDRWTEANENDPVLMDANPVNFEFSKDTFTTWRVVANVSFHDDIANVKMEDGGTISEKHGGP